MFKNKKKNPITIRPETTDASKLAQKVFQNVIFISKAFMQSKDISIDDEWNIELFKGNITCLGFDF